ncbi:adenylate/guanylate cyclase domain-containing protein [soil metagenome]
MAWSISDRRRLRTWLVAVVLGGFVGYGYMFIMYPLMQMESGPPTAGEALKGFRTGMVIAGLAVGFDLYGLRTPIGSWLRQLSFVPAFVVREAILATIVVVSLVLNAAISRWTDGEQPLFHYPLHNLLIDTAFSFAVCGLILFFIQMRHLIGARTLTNILLGRYHQPIREERLFAIFDLQESTRIAAAIGDERFHALLSSIFADADREVVDHGGEVHSFVGDALIATWPLRDQKRNAFAVMAAFAIFDGLAQTSLIYRRRFGFTPRFRVALHGGPVIAGECGDSKRQITYLGDVLNVTARLEQVAKKIDADFVVSADMLPLLALPANVHVLDRGEHALNGVEKPLRVISLGRGETPARRVRRDTASAKAAVGG